MTNSESDKNHLKRSKTSLLRKKKSERVGSDAPEQIKPDDQDNKQEEMYKTLIENIPCAVYSAFPGKKGPTIFISKNWKDWTGYSAEEFYQDPEAWPKCIYPDDREKAVNAYIEACKNETPYNLEYRIVHRDTGQVLYVRDQGFLSKDAKGILIRVDGIITDITEVKTSVYELAKYRDHLEELVKERTEELEKANEVLQQQVQERKEAEEALRENEARYKAVVDNAQEGIVLVQDKMLKFVNPKVMFIMGSTEDELTSRPFIEFVHPEDRDKVLKIHLKRFKGEEVPEVYEFRIFDKQDNTRWLESNGILIEWEGRPATLNFLRDITERKKAEEAMRESEKELDTIFNSSPVAMILLDADTTIQKANLAATAAAGRKQEDIHGLQPGEAFYCVCFSDDPRGCGFGSECSTCDVRSTVEDTLETGMPHDQVEVMITVEHEGISTNSFLLVSTTFLNIAGDPYVLVTLEDVTERKKAGEKLLDYQAKLKSLASQLSITEESERRRIATELHDQIGQTLVFSKLKLDELQHTTGASDLTKTLNEISNNIDQVIQDTRTLTFDLSSPVLNEIGFETAVSEWLEERIQEKHGINIEFEDDGQTKELDDDIRSLLFRNIRELLINVVKHAQASNVKVSISKVDSQICVSVEDDGVGIKSTDITSLASENGGFGIFSIRERLEQLGGRLEIDTERRGSKITMTAPLKLTKSKRNLQNS